MSWDVDPATLKNLSDTQQDALADKQNRGEYSTTQVINDLNPSQSPMTPESTNQMSTPTQNSDQISRILSIVALAISVVSLGLGLRKTSARNQGQI